MSMTRHLSLPQDFGRIRHKHDQRQTEAVTSNGQGRDQRLYSQGRRIRIRTCRDCSSVISSEAFIPFRVISLVN